MESAIAIVERDGEIPPVIVVRDDSWHQGIVGLIAGRLKERFHRPALAFTLTPEGVWTGSARSVPGLDIGEAVHRLVAAGHATKGGGHAMAAGLTVDEEAWVSMRDALLADLTEASVSSTSSQSLKIDSVLTASGASLDLAHAIEKVAPYGTGFPEPVFAFASHRITFAGPVGTNHIKATLSDGQGPRLPAIAFRAAGSPLGEALMAARNGAPMHVAGTISINSWQGRDSVQLRILDAAKP